MRATDKTNKYIIEIISSSALISSRGSGAQHSERGGVIMSMEGQEKLFIIVINGANRERGVA